MSGRFVVGFVLLVLVGAIAGPVSAGAPAEADTAASTGVPGTLGAQSDLGTPTFVITVYENGSARWTFQYSRELENESERENFEAFAEEFNQNSTELYENFGDRANALASQGADATGRSMDARAFSRRAYVGSLGNQGVVEMSFLWTGFAAPEGNGLLVGDVFEGGLYLGADQRLRIEHGPNLVFGDGVAPGPDATSGESIRESGSLTWRGERQFTDNHPRVPLEPAGTAPTGTPTETPVGGGIGVPATVAALVVLLLAGAAAVAWRSDALGDDGGATGRRTDRGTGGGGGGAAAAGTTGEPAIPDEEFVSDDDRVVRLLEEHGGRMKQVNIVDETGWSKSKVSMLLSDMEEEGAISKLRVGRENVISLKGHEPDAAKSPFDEE